jgi:hypothetical protein
MRKFSLIVAALFTAAFVVSFGTNDTFAQSAP